MAGNTTWVHMGSEGISKLFNKMFWPLPGQLVYKKETPTTSGDRLMFSQKILLSPVSHICNPFP